FIFATESYGGHYGPSFVTYFDQQNALIRDGTILGEEIIVSALMINNGWYDPLIQNQAYVDFATNAPGYGQLQTDEVIKKLNDAFYKPGGCKDQEESCYAAGNTTASNKICVDADNFCVCSRLSSDASAYDNPVVVLQIENVFVPAVGDRDSDDLRQNGSAPLFPPEYYVDFLGQATIRRSVGAEVAYSECANAPNRLFGKTGDVSRTTTFLVVRRNSDIQFFKCVRMHAHGCLNLAL
ncbi:hypothetical protein H0H87_001000, partial [Tephrocybe sp. NHM501043]